MFFGFSVFDELDALDESHSSDVADNSMPVFHIEQAFGDLLAAESGVLD